MRTSAKLPRFLPWLLLAVVLPLGTSTGQGLRELPGTEVIRGFLTTMYPEVLTPTVYAELSSYEPFEAAWTRLHAGQFTIFDHATVFLPTRRTPETPFPLQEGKAREIMRGDFRLDDRGRLKEFHAHDSFVLSSGKHTDLRMLVQSHREWKEEQGLRALMEAMPRYGPGEREAFLKSVPISDLEPFLGKVTIRSVSFDTMLEADGQFPVAALFQWHLMVEGQRTDEPKTEYILHFEPFGGKLTDIRTR